MIPAKPPLNHTSFVGFSWYHDTSEAPTESYINRRLSHGTMIPAKPPLNHTSTVEYGTMIPAKPPLDHTSTIGYTMVP